MPIVSGAEGDLDCIEYHQLSQNFALKFDPQDILKLSGIPGPSLLAISTVHGLIFFPLDRGFGWASLSKISKLETLEHGSRNLEFSPTSFAIHGPHDRFLVIGTKSRLYMFEMSAFRADPISCEPLHYFQPSEIRNIVSTGKELLCLMDLSVYELKVDTGFVDRAIPAKLITMLPNKQLVTVSPDDEIKLHGANLETLWQFSKPTDIVDFEFVSLCAVDEHSVLLGAETVNKTKPFIDLFLLNFDDPTEWTRFFDPTHPRLKGPSAILSVNLYNWDSQLSNLLIICNVSSAEVGTMGRLGVAEPFSSFFLTTDEYLAQLPVSEIDSRRDMLPVAMTLDFTNIEDPKSPLLWILTNEGVLCPYRIVKNDSSKQYHAMDFSSNSLPPIRLAKRDMSQRSFEVFELEKGKESQFEKIVEKASLKTPTKEVKIACKTIEQDSIIAKSTEPKTPKLDTLISSMGSAEEPSFITLDLGKFNNALTLEFLSLHSSIKDDFNQLRDMLFRNRDRLTHLAKTHKKTFFQMRKQIDLLSVKCDNPAFSEMYKFEIDVKEMIMESERQINGAKALKNSFQTLGNFQAQILEYQKSFESKVAYLERSMNGLDAAAGRDLVDMGDNLISDICSSIEKINFKTAQIQDSVNQLEKEFIKLDPFRVPTPPLFKDFPTVSELNPRTMATPSVPKADSRRTKVSPTQLALLTSKYQIRSSTDCLHHVSLNLSAEKFVESSRATHPSIVYNSKLYEGRAFTPLCGSDEEAETHLVVEELEDVLIYPVEQDIEGSKIEEPVIVETEEQWEDAEADVLGLLKDIKKTQVETVHAIDSPIAFERYGILAAPSSFTIEEPEKVQLNEALFEYTPNEEVQQAIPSERESSIVSTEAESGLMTEAIKYANSVQIQPAAGEKETKSLPSHPKEELSFSTTLFGRVHRSNVDLVGKPFVEHTAKEAEESNLQSNSLILAAEGKQGEDDMEVNEDNLVEMSESVNKADEMTNSFNGVLSRLGSSALESSREQERNVFGVPQGMQPASSFSQTKQNESQSRLEAFKPTALSSFAPSSESIFSKAASNLTGDQIAQSSSEAQMMSIFVQPSSVPGFGSQPAFGTSGGFGQPSVFGSAPSGFGQPLGFGQGATEQDNTTFGQSAFRASSLGAPASFGSSSGFGQASTLNNPLNAPTPFSQPSKVFGQGSTFGSASVGFSALASQTSQASGNVPPNPVDPTIQTKKLPSSFSQFRG